MRSPPTFTTDAVRICAFLCLFAGESRSAEERIPDAATLTSKVLCGYQGWFRCPGDAAELGWVHWSRDRGRITSDTVTFEMWPDMREYAPGEGFLAPGFEHRDGKPAFLFSSDYPQTVLRHFQWMQQYGIDGVWLQHFVVDLPGGPSEMRYASRRRVMNHVASACQQTRRVWAITFDIAGAPADQVFDLLTSEWKRLVDEGITSHPRYLHEDGHPVVQIFGFYPEADGIPMTLDLGRKLINFFHADGPYRAYLAGSGAWFWRTVQDPRWQELILSLDAYSPWNVANFSTDAAGMKHATTNFWKDDLQLCRSRGVRWLPVVYPGFSWDNLKRLPPGTSLISRREGDFLWEQFHALSALKVDCAFVAMFDEVDEGTAIFKVSSDPPSPGRFITYDGRPSDWYLRLTGIGAAMLRGEIPSSKAIPIPR